MLREPKNYVIFNGKNLADFGVYVSGDGTFNSAERDYSVIGVPGRSGDLYFDNKRYMNVNLSYSAWIAEDLEDNLSDLRDFLGSSIGYCRLEDTYHPDEYRMAVFKGPLNASVAYLSFGSFNLEFNCKPQRFLKSGETQVSLPVNQNVSLRNPTRQEAKPIIRVYGYGGIMFGSGGEGIVISQHSRPYVDIDCETMNCYWGTINMNRYVTIQNSPTGFPVLKAGTTVVKAAGSGITNAYIIPRWWKL